MNQGLSHTSATPAGSGYRLEAESGIIPNLPGWRNGIRRGLKTPGRQRHESSNLSLGTPEWNSAVLLALCNCRRRLVREGFSRVPDWRRQ